MQRCGERVARLIGFEDAARDDGGAAVPHDLRALEQDEVGLGGIRERQLQAVKVARIPRLKVVCP